MKMTRKWLSGVMLMIAGILETIAGLISDHIAFLYFISGGLLIACGMAAFIFQNKPRS